MRKERMGLFPDATAYVGERPHRRGVGVGGALEGAPSAL